ncbi:MAG: tetratricopeptide repeat protein [Candidatus Eisenbacteria bacterium]
MTKSAMVAAALLIPWLAGNAPAAAGDSLWPGEERPAPEAEILPPADIDWSGEISAPDHRIVTLAPGGPLLESPILSRLTYYRAVHELAQNRWDEAREHLETTVGGDPSLIRAHLLLSVVQLRDLDPHWILSLMSGVRALRGNFRSQSLLVANGVIVSELILLALLTAATAAAVLRALPVLRHAVLEAVPAGLPRSLRLAYPVMIVVAVIFLFRPWSWMMGVVWLVLAGVLLTGRSFSRAEKGVALAFVLSLALSPGLLRFAVQASLPATPGTTLFALSGTSVAPLGDERASTLLVGDTGDRDIIFSLALLERERGNRKKAISLYRELLANGQGSPSVYNNIGNLLFVEGDVDQAYTAYRQALTLDPERATSHYNLGQLYLEVFSFDQARQEFSKASEIDFSLIRNLSHAGGSEGSHTLVDDSIPPSRLWGRFLAGEAGSGGLGWSESFLAAKRVFYPHEPERFLPLLLFFGFAFWFGQTRPAPAACARCGKAICRKCRVRVAGKNRCGACALAGKDREWNRNTLTYHRPMSLTLALILPGLGHVYLGRWLRGFGYAAASLALVLFWIFRGPLLKPFPVLYAADLAPLENFLFAWLFMPLYVFVVFDTVRLAKKTFRTAGGRRAR